MGILPLQDTPHGEHPLFRVMLQGPYVSQGQFMADTLRSAGLIPLSEPFTAMGFAHVGSGGETLDPAVLDSYGPNSIVDWVFLELRDEKTLEVAETLVCLVQQDGDIV